MNFYEGYTELIPVDKQNYLNDHCPFDNDLKLTDKKRCIHCNKVIVVGGYKVYKENGPGRYDRFEYICCPNAPECDGTIIDWMEVGSSVNDVGVKDLSKLSKYFSKQE